MRKHINIFQLFVTDKVKLGEPDNKYFPQSFASYMIKFLIFRIFSIDFLNSVIKGVYWKYVIVASVHPGPLLFIRSQYNSTYSYTWAWIVFL